MRENFHIKSHVEKESDKQVCISFKWELIGFIKLMDSLLENRALSRQSEFLDQMAETVIGIDPLSRHASGCGEDLEIAALLIQNMLHQPLDLSDGELGATLLGTASEYKKSKTPAFCRVMIACIHYDKETRLLLDSLKLIAHDL